MSLWMVASATLLLSLGLTAGYRHLAIIRSWVDIPNHRSSHTQIVPRGAGIVFALLMAAAACLGAALGAMPATLAAAVSVGLCIAVIGWWDDLKGVSAPRRFCLYWLVSLLALTIIGLPMMPFAQKVGLSLALFVVSVALQWLINLYNFMDGINGIAAAEAIFVLAAALALGVGANGLTWLLMCSIAALCGFLVWNFPVARVFMGDAGSAFLGFLLGLMMIWSGLNDGLDAVVWLILLGVFIVDATYTLLVRMATGQAWHQGHRSHAYQLLADSLGSHARVVGVMTLVNLLWLLPWALTVSRHWVPAGWAFTAAYLPLVLTCCVVGAGNLSPTRV